MRENTGVYPYRGRISSGRRRPRLNTYPPRAPFGTEHGADACRRGDRRSTAARRRGMAADDAGAYTHRLACAGDAAQASGHIVCAAPLPPPFLTAPSTTGANYLAEYRLVYATLPRPHPSKSRRPANRGPCECAHAVSTSATRYGRSHVRCPAARRDLRRIASNVLCLFLYMLDTVAKGERGVCAMRRK